MPKKLKKKYSVTNSLFFDNQFARIPPPKNKNKNPNVHQKLSQWPTIGMDA
jgi:hypothetical protein